MYSSRFFAQNEVHNKPMQLYTAPAILIELQYLNRYLNMVRVSMVTICQGMHSNLGDLPSTPSSYACPINTKKL